MNVLNYFFDNKKTTLNEVFKDNKFKNVIIHDTLEYKNNIALSNDKGVVNLVGEFLGHFVYYHLQWVISIAQRNGIKKLYFTSRDTKLMYECCKVFIEQNSIELEIEYLLISRQTIALASVITYTRSEFIWLERYFEIDPLAKTLNRLELQYTDIESFIVNNKLNWTPETILKDSASIDQFWNFIFQPEIELLLSNKIQNRRVKVIEYFKSIGLLDNKNTAIVDLGWFKSIQYKINKIIHTVNNDLVIKGIYFGVVEKRHDDKISGESFSLFQEEFQKENNQYIFNNIPLLEYIVGICNNGSVIGYEYTLNNRIDVRCKEISESSILFYNSVEKEVIQFFKSKISEKRSFDFSDQEIQIILNKLVCNFVKYPTKEMLHVIKNISVSSFVTNEESKRLLSPVSLFDLIFNRSKFYESIIYWPYANILISSKTVQIFYYFYKKINRKFH